MVELDRKGRQKKIRKKKKKLYFRTKNRPTINNNYKCNMLQNLKKFD